MTTLTEADVKAMTESDLYGALSLIQEEIKRREEGGFAETVLAFLRETDDAELRAKIAAGGGERRLTFTTGQWEDGFFYNEREGALTLAYGGVIEVDFHHTTVHDALAELSYTQRREDGLGSDNVLEVDLLTGETVHEVRS